MLGTDSFEEMQERIEQSLYVEIDCADLGGYHGLLGYGIDAER